MVGFPSTHKCLLIGLFVTASVFLLADVHLYFCVQSAHLRNDTETCGISPFCHVSVKMLMMDHTNHYINHVVADAFNTLLDFRISLMFISANAISVSHVFVALAGARCLVNDSLAVRRIGVGFFLIRNFLDALDGVVARARKNIKTNISEVGSTGYFVDGFCDGLGCIFLFLSCILYLRAHPPKRGSYTLLPFVDVKEGISKGHVSSAKIVRLVVCYAMQTLLSSTAWNRYIDLYQEALQSEPVTARQAIVQEQVRKSAIMWCIFWLWRVLNVCSLVQYLLVAIFFDRLWEFLVTVQYLGFVFLSSLISLSEMHVHDIQVYIQSMGSWDAKANHERSIRFTNFS